MGGNTLLLQICIRETLNVIAQDEIRRLMQGNGLPELKSSIDKVLLMGQTYGGIFVKRSNTMRSGWYSLLGLAILVAVLASCGASAETMTAQLAFEAKLNVDSSQRFHVSLGVQNVGTERFRQYEDFRGAMQLRDSGGVEIGRISVATLWELAPGNAGWPASYACQLPAGAYQLTWGTPTFGTVSVNFTIVELDGRLYLGEESIQSTSGMVSDDEREFGALQSLMSLARVNLAQRLGVEPELVTVQSIEKGEFPDASLSAPEPDKLYAQVVTPGHIIRLAVAGHTYEYHASNERLVFVPREEGPPLGIITVEGAEVTASEQILVYGRSTLPDGTCLGSELWAIGEPQAWWPGDDCAMVESGTWQMAVELGIGEIPRELDQSAQYMLRVYQQNGPNIVTVFSFTLADLLTPES